MTTDILITSRIVNAPVQAVFDVLAEPANHAAIDGTGWVRESLDGKPLQENDQIFRIAMYHDNLPEGHYEMANRVIGFDPPNTIAWEPGQGPDGDIEYGGWTWRYDLEPSGDGTQVTMTYDWSGVPSETREHIEFPPFPASHVENSLKNLAALAEGR
jgi:uncharacterized protein YndB with AHSA1/START domain